MDAVDAFSHLRLQMPHSTANDDDTVRKHLGYGEEAIIRLHELFLSRLVPGYDVLGYAEIRELFTDAGVLASPSCPEEMPSCCARERASGSLRVYALADALFDQLTYETFVVEVIGEVVARHRQAEKFYAASCVTVKTESSTIQMKRGVR